MTKSSTRESPPQRSEQPQSRRRNAYDYDGEYEFAVVRHWTAPETITINEIDYWNGSVVRQGRALDVATPANQFIYYSVLPQELQARGK